MQSHGTSRPLDAFSVIAQLTPKTYRAKATRGRLKGREVLIKKSKQAIERPASNCHQGLYHPNIVVLFSTFCWEKYVYRVLEYCSKGSLGDYLTPSHVALSQRDAHSLRQDITRAVAYLHEIGIVHRQICPQVIYVDADRRFKLGGFEYACKVQDSFALVNPPDSPFTAPEVTRGGPHSFASDIWSVTKVISVSSRHQNEYGYDDYSEWYTRLHHLLDRILGMTPVQRPSAQTLLNNPCFSGWQFNPETSVSDATFSVETTSSWEASLEACSEASEEGEMWDQIKHPPLQLRKFCDFYEEYESDSSLSEFSSARTGERHHGDEQTSCGTDDLTPKQVNYAFLYDEGATTSEAVLESKEAFFHTEINEPASSLWTESTEGRDFSWLGTSVASILSPKVYALPDGGTLRILQSRCLLIESPPREPILVDHSGRLARILNKGYSMIDIESPHLRVGDEEGCPIEALPSGHTRLLATAEEILDEVKSRTPMLIMHVMDGKCMLMCNAPLPDVEILLRSQSETEAGGRQTNMLRVRLLRRAGTIEFAQRITGGTHSEWQKKLYSSAQEPPLLSASDMVHLDKKERESLEVLNHFLKICRVTEAQ